MNKKEKVILSLLVQGGAFSIKDLSTKTKMSRLTLLYNLKKLEKRNLVTKETAKKAHLWKMALPMTNGDSPSTTLSIDEAYIQLHKSRPHLIKGIQGDLAVRQLLKKLKTDPSYFDRIHNTQKLRKVIIDSILPRESLAQIQNTSLKLLKSHHGRPTEAHVLENAGPIADYEILCSGKMLVIVDWKKEKAQMINDEIVSKAIQGLLEIIKANGVKKNISEIYGLTQR